MHRVVAKRRSPSLVVEPPVGNPEAARHCRRRVHSDREDHRSDLRPALRPDQRVFGMGGRRAGARPHHQLGHPTSARAVGAAPRALAVRRRPVLLRALQPRRRSVADVARAVGHRRFFPRRCARVALPALLPFHGAAVLGLLAAAHLRRAWAAVVVGGVPRRVSPRSSAELVVAELAPLRAGVRQNDARARRRPLLSRLHRDVDPRSARVRAAQGGAAKPADRHHFLGAAHVRRQ